MPADTIRSRLDEQGWDTARALTTPADARFAKRPKKLPPKIPRPIPHMKEHSSGQAYARWYAHGHSHQRYFGKWGSEEAAENYRRFQLEWIAGFSERPNRSKEVGVAELCARYLDWAQRHYKKKGEPTGHVQRVRSSIKPLLRTYARLPIVEFGVDQLRCYVATLVQEGRSLRTVNDYHCCVVKMFSWGVPAKLVEPGVVHYLERVEKQLPGRSDAPDTIPVRSAPMAGILAALPHLHIQPGPRAVFEAMIRLQLASGMRSGEGCAMRVRDLERDHGELWRYEPWEVQKNQHRGKRRVIWLGPRAQAVIRPLLDGLQPDDRVFGYERTREKVRLGVTVNLYRYNVFKACKQAGHRTSANVRR